MKRNKLYIFSFILILICMSLLSEYHDLSEFNALSVLLQAYSGVNLYGNISGYTLALYIGMNVSLIIITMNTINSIFGMYNYIYVRCYSKSKFIILCAKKCFYQVLILTITNLTIDFIFFMLLDRQLYLNGLYLSFCLFLNLIELFIFECLLLIVRLKPKFSILIIFSVYILMPILCSINQKCLKWIPLFPASSESLTPAIIIPKIILTIILLYALIIALKKYDGLSNEVGST